MQWRDITSENGIKQLSFNLSSEPIQGFYKIMVLKKSGEKKEHVFSVEEYGMVLEDWEEKVDVIVSGNQSMNLLECIYCIWIGMSFN